MGLTAILRLSIKVNLPQESKEHIKTFLSSSLVLQTLFVYFHDMIYGTVG